MKSRIRTHRDLEVYCKAFEAAMKLFEASRKFPKEETYSLTDQVRRSSRSVCANLAEAWRKRRYKAAFITKLNDAESEACETQVWLELSSRFGYLTTVRGEEMQKRYDNILGQLVRMIELSDRFLIR